MPLPMKLNILSLIILILLSAPLTAKPLAGIVFFDHNTSRGEIFASLIEKHSINILNNTGIFSTINEGIINRELKKFTCIDEKCILNFAENAGIDLIIKGKISDHGDHAILTLNGFGIKNPFNKKLIYSYKVKVPAHDSITPRDFSLIFEEHSGIFISKLLKAFIFPVELTSEGGSVKAATELKVNGSYRIFNAHASAPEKSPVTIDLKDNRGHLPGHILSGGERIFLRFRKEGEDLNKYYIDGKKDIVFEEPSLYDTLFVFFFTVPGSATMPISAPLLGYFNNDDWQGLGLWGVNASPYLYAEARGFLNSPSRLKKDKKDISKDDRALNYFAWYMLLAGGTPLFIDSFASKYLYDASNFKEKQGLMGNPYTAAYLAAVSNGGGMFYRGHRSWGYFYFHINNILLYSVLREFSRPETYDNSTNKYSRGDNNKKRGALFASALTLSKAAEIVHSIIIKDNIKNGNVKNEYILPEIFMTLDSSNIPVYNLGLSLKF